MLVLFVMLDTVESILANLAHKFVNLNDINVERIP